MVVFSNIVWDLRNARNVGGTVSPFAVGGTDTPVKPGGG